MTRDNSISWALLRNEPLPTSIARLIESYLRLTPKPKGHITMTKRTLDGAFPSRFLSSGDVEGKRFDAVIKRIDYEKMSDGSEKAVAFFEDMKKGCVLNKTRASFLASLTKSKKFDDWIGTSVQISGGVTQLRGEEVACIRFERTDAQKALRVKEELNDDLPDSMKGDVADAGDDDL
jgi:hypothetical protein